MSLWDSLLTSVEVIERLRREAAAPSPAHAWLFCGSSGADPARTALVFAASLLCEQSDPAQRGCGVCKSCITVLNGSHADVTDFRTEALNISIEQARDLVVKAQDRPAVGRHRIIICQDAQRMPERTSNVLLKAIEEPPAHTIWILTAPAPTDVLITIRSRCCTVLLPLPGVERVAQALISQGADEQMASRIAAMTLGDISLAQLLLSSPEARERFERLPRTVLSLRSVAQAMDAASKLLDAAASTAEQMSAARNERERAELLAVLGIAEGERVPAHMRAQIKRLEDEQKRRAKRVQTDSLLLSVSQILSVLRDVLALQLGTGAPLVNAHALEQLQAWADATTAAANLERVEAVETALKRLRTNAQPRLVLEGLLTRFIQH